MKAACELVDLTSLVEWLNGRPEPRVQWRFSRHALHRASEMDVTEADVLLVLDDPEVVYPSQGRWISQRGELAACWIDDFVVSVLYRKRESYDLYGRAAS